MAKFKWKACVRDMLAHVLEYLHVTSPGFRSRDNLFIATFHRVLPEKEYQEYPLPGLAVTPEELDWFIRFFKMNFNCQRLDVAWHEFNNQINSDRPRLAITFDDGQLDNYLYAAPVLDINGVPGTFFVPVDAVAKNELLWHDQMAYAISELVRNYPQSKYLLPFNFESNLISGLPVVGVSKAKLWSPCQRELWIEQVKEEITVSKPEWDGMMTWEQLNELVNRGHEIGSHSYSHPLLVQCDRLELETEIINSKQFLEDKLGIKVTSFCYPNGNFNQRVAELTSRAGYRLAVSTQWGSNPHSCDAFALKRHDMVTNNSRNRRGSLSSSILAMRMAGLVRGGIK